MTARPESEYPPSGCNWCGRVRYGHFQRWGSGVGFHKFEPPTKQLIRARLMERYGKRRTTT